MSAANAPKLRCKQNGAVTPTALSGEGSRKIQESTLRAGTAREPHHMPLSTVSHEIQTSEAPRPRHQKVADEQSCNFCCSWKTVGLARVHDWTPKSSSGTKCRSGTYSPKAGGCP